MSFDLNGDVTWDFFSVCVDVADEASALPQLQAIVPGLQCGNINPDFAGCAKQQVACMGPELQTEPGTYTLTEQQLSELCALSLLTVVKSIHGGHYL